MQEVIANFQVGVTKDEKWIITPGVFITHDDKQFHLKKAFELKVKQKENCWLYVFLAKKSKPPNPVFFATIKEPEWDLKKNAMFYKGHRLIATIPPSGMRFLPILDPDFIKLEG